MRSMDYIGISQTIGRVIVKVQRTKYSVLYVFQFTLTLVSQPQERSKQLFIQYSTKDSEPQQLLHDE